MEAAVTELGCLLAALRGSGCHNITGGGHLMPSLRNLTIPLFAGILLLGGLTACDREGPMERAGEKVDESVERAGDKVERATDK
jgi:hypothetical protein